ncbi:hypothetical protein LWI29_029468 [Acer saccharum]|uniref:Aconitase/3-isopropylmalate dehydratase large subunit alpha/beta/alpha domain-containing protein n=1 Tax=Acer saccharum TaxID=4024 RepID=A0AA39T101_ACESA|nr:hypothetical protein LWI29_029468 [Acer saccharum]
MPGGGEFGKFYSLPALNDLRIDRLPYSIRILLESAIRNCDNFQVTKEDVEKFIDWENTSPKLVEIPFKPARVLLQVNLEYLGRVVFNTDGLLYPDSVVGTDSHTTMIDGLGVAGWGVGGIKAEAAMLGQLASNGIAVILTAGDEKKGTEAVQSLALSELSCGVSTT